MGWNEAAPRSADLSMTPAQRAEIIRLRENHDGASPGEYSGDHLPPWTKYDAMKEIDKLRAKLDASKTKKTYTDKCPFCGKMKPCGCRLSLLSASRR
jgi:hypothetical protein